MRNIFNERVVGPVTTILATVTYHLLVVNIEVIPPAVALLWPFTIWAGFIGGIRSGVIAALWVSGYAFYALSPGELPRATIILVGTLIGSIMVGYRTQQLRSANDELRTAFELEKESRLQAEYNQAAANFVEELNGNIELLNEILGSVNNLLNDWPNLNNEVRWDTIRLVKHSLNNLMLRTSGWRQLAMIRELVNEGTKEIKRREKLDISDQEDQSE